MAALIVLLVPWEPAPSCSPELVFCGRQDLCLGGAGLCSCAVGLRTYMSSPLALGKGEAGLEIPYPQPINSALSHGIEGLPCGIL